MSSARFTQTVLFGSRRRRSLLTGVALAFAIGGLACGESSNPVAPTAAGTVEGGATRGALDFADFAAEGDPQLKASAPVTQIPNQGAEVDDLTPTLTVVNGEGLHVSSLSFMHEFQVTRVGGGGILVDEGEESGGAGTTSYVVRTTLENDTDYEWRARAVYDGEYGPWSDVAMFRTHLPDQILAPALIQPIGGQVVNSVRPILEVGNPLVEGNPGTVSIEFEVSADPDFLVLIDTLFEETGQHAGIDTTLTGSPQTALPRDRRTSAQLTTDLETGETYHWRARGTNGSSVGTGTVIGDYSESSFFMVEEEAAVGGGGTASAGTGADEIDLSTVTWLHTNVSSWPQTSTITSTRMDGPPVCINHTKVGQWKTGDFSGSGAIVDSNVWVFAKVRGTWYAATWEWLRAGTTCKDFRASDFRTHVNGASPLNSWTPRSGEQIGVMVSTPARLGTPAGRERTNVVLVTWR